MQNHSSGWQLSWQTLNSERNIEMNSDRINITTIKYGRNFLMEILKKVNDYIKEDDSEEMRIAKLSGVNIVLSALGMHMVRINGGWRIHGHKDNELNYDLPLVDGAELKFNGGELVCRNYAKYGME